MRIEVEAQDGRTVGATALGQYLSEGNAEAGTALIRAAIPNRGGWIRPGMTMRGRVIVNQENVPLAVRTEAIQPFRDFQVVYARSEEHTSELPSLMRNSYAVFCLNKKKNTRYINNDHNT